MSTIRSEKKALKRQRIIEAALAVFSELGYVGASLDEIAKQAQVSKPTLYQYFGNKEQLFSSVLDATANRILAPLEVPDQDQSLVQTLLNFSQTYADIVLSPNVLSMGRLVISVVECFPEIGEQYYQSGPQKALEGITHYLKKQAQSGNIELSDPEMAAHDFWSLILSGPREMYQLMPNKNLTKEEIDRFIFNGLKVFLKSYSNYPEKDLKELSSIQKII